MTTLVVVLIVLWALGFFTANTMGGLIHLLLLVALAVVAIRVIRGQKPFPT